MREEDKPAILTIARSLRHMGFTLVATRNTYNFLARHGLAATRVAKIGEGKPDVVDLCKAVQFLPDHQHPIRQALRRDGYAIRRTALELNIPCITNI